jgi:hypothetical protein
MTTRTQRQRPYTCLLVAATLVSVVQGWTCPPHRSLGARRSTAPLLWASFEPKLDEDNTRTVTATKEVKDEDKDMVTNQDCETCVLVILMDPDAVVTDSMPIVYYDGPMSRKKEQVSKILGEPLVEVVMCSLVLLSSLLVALETLPDLDPVTENVIRYLLNTVGLVFVADFSARWFAAPQPFSRHVFKPRFFVEVLAVIFPLLFGWTPNSWWDDTFLPNWLTSPGGLINLQLFRVVRLQRILKDMDTFTKFEQAIGLANQTGRVREWQLQLARVFTSLFTLLSVSTGFIYTAEHGANPGITDYFTALYFGLTTLTTVGFGDVTPVTWEGKLIVCGSIIAGVAVVPIQAAELVEALLARQADRELAKAAAATTSKFTTMNNNGATKAVSRATSAIAATNGSTTTLPSNGRMVLETTCSCSTCGAAMHWSNACYCWSCGAALNLDEE